MEFACCGILRGSRLLLSFAWHSESGPPAQSSALTMLKIALVAPIPSARQMTEAAVNPGEFHNMRIPYRRSCQNVFMIGPFQSDEWQHWWCRTVIRSIRGKVTA